MRIINKAKGFFRKTLDIVLVPFIYISSLIIRYIRRTDFWFNVFKRTKKIFLKVGIYPLLDHYYEPLFHPRHFHKSTREDRVLPGIDLNPDNQINFLKTLKYEHELESIPLNKTSTDEFYYNNNTFEDTDAQMYYQIIRTYKPKRIIEIGSGFSTKLALTATKKNKEELNNYIADLICIEPYENKWLEKCKDIKLMREKAETIDKEIIKTLNKDDVLFIDCSHIIRPQGDVLAIYLEIIPIVKPGVFIHIHDIWTPKDYCDIENDNFHFFNEQYILEAFLSFNPHYEIVAANNYLFYHHFDELKKKCPIAVSQKGLGSFWIRKK